MTEEKIRIPMADIAKLLGVSRQQVSTWAMRRERNGFPSPVGKYTRGFGQYDLFDEEEILAWHASYTPHKGGAPRGERNGRSATNRRRAAGE